jgi:hypothetical protein
MPPKQPDASLAPKGPKGIEKCKLPCAEAKFRIKCALYALLLLFLLMLFYSPPCLLAWWGALGLCICVYSLFWWLQVPVPPPPPPPAFRQPVPPTSAVFSQHPASAAKCFRKPLTRSHCSHSSEAAAYPLYISFCASSCRSPTASATQPPTSNTNAAHR